MDLFSHFLYSVTTTEHNTGNMTVSDIPHCRQHYVESII